eukprot:SAG25_NODE_5871_length_611_cov_1.103516_2_plen_84_part_01
MCCEHPAASVSARLALAVAASSSPEVGNALLLQHEAGGKATTITIMKSRVDDCQVQGPAVRSDDSPIIYIYIIYNIYTTVGVGW